MIMRLTRFILLFPALVLLATCSSSNMPQKLDSFVDNAELKSNDYDAEDWQNSMLQYEELVEEFSNSGKEYSNAEKQMAARAMGRYHSLLIKNGIEQSAAYLKELESILPSYLEGLIDGLGENSEEFGKTLEGISNSEELEKAFDGLGNRLEELFGGIEETK